MPDNTGGQGSVNARELWKQWSDTTAHMWESILSGTKASYIDPYGLYQAWFKTISNFQKQVMEQAKAPSVSQATEVWKQWMDTTTQIWSKAAKEAQAGQQSMYQAWLTSISAFQEQARRTYGTLANPQEVWQQWTDSIIQVWNDALSPKNASAMAPYALYQAWLKTMTVLQEQMKGSPLTMSDAQEAWNRWFEYATEAWLKTAEAGTDPLGLTAQWLKMLEETRTTLQANGTFPTDSFTLYKQWYDATSETWTRVAERIIGTEQFIDAARRFTDNYASYTLAMRRANEAYFHSLQLPTRSDIARVANLVIALEDKVDKLEDAFENSSDRERAPSQQAAAEQHVDAHLRAVEGKGDALQVTIAQIDTAAALRHLDQRLTQVEDKLDQFLHLLEKIEDRVGTDKPSEPRRKSAKTPPDVVASNGFAAEAISSESMQ